MRYVKWTFWGLVLLVIVSVFHYSTPRREVVRINDTYERRVDFGMNRFFYAQADTGGTEAVNRDVFFVQTFRPSGRPFVLRNEDTGWGWPFFFKVTSANLQARAADLISTDNDPEWVAITYYGVRNELLSIHPNALSVRAATGPDERLIPWRRIVTGIVLFGVLAFLVGLWRAFRRNRIDPVLEDIDEAADDARDRARGLWRRITGR
ncbi:MAG: DUF1523 family protein [Pseudomonadota bacterium]